MYHPSCTWGLEVPFQMIGNPLSGFPLASFPGMTICGGWVDKWSSDMHAAAIPRWLSGEESTCQCRRFKRHRFDPWFGKIPWSRKRQAAPVFLPGKFLGQKSLAGYSPWGHRRVGHNLVTKEQQCMSTFGAGWGWVRREVGRL